MKISRLIIAFAFVSSCADDGAQDMNATSQSSATATSDAGAFRCPSGTHLVCEPRAKLEPACSCTTAR